MLKMFGAVGAAVLFAFAGAASAEEANGKIEALDPGSGIIILDDGQTYTVAEGVSIEGLQPGDTVTVSFEIAGDVNKAMAVTKAE